MDWTPDRTTSALAKGRERVQKARMSNLLALAATFLLAFLITVALRRFRKGYPSFSAWWNAEGIPIFMLVLVVVMGLAMRLGYLSSYGDAGSWPTP
jgi:hypothetical protein